MASLEFQFSFYFIVLHLAIFTAAQPNILISPCSVTAGNNAANDGYRRNLNTVLSSMAENTEIDYGFYNLSIGQIPNQIDSVALCRGDLALQDCRSCIINATSQILKDCPNQKEAFGIYDFCMLRYSNRSIFRDTGGPEFQFSNTENVSSSALSQFNQVLQGLLVRLRNTAKLGNSTSKFAAGYEQSGFYTIYALVQCTPDLSEQDCEGCLSYITSRIPGTKFAGKIGGRFIKQGCNFRFETNQFYRNTSDVSSLSPPQQSSPVPATQPPEGMKSNKAKTVISIVVPIVGTIILAICICIFLRKRNRKAKLQNKEDEIKSVDPLQFDFGTIRNATNDFSNENKLGQGGFGAVYKGKLSNGEEIAVKRLSKDSQQGDSEFKTEVRLVAKLQHRNLVRLLGFCLEGSERLLVYEFLPNISLDHFIFDENRRSQLDWSRRYKIIDGIARGLLYIHQDSRLRIIHRDLKANNILLDAEMNPKISDFGLAKLFVMDQTRGNTIRIAGTPGYMAPEYRMHGDFSDKTDVFSFGVLLLEIIFGKRNNGENEKHLLSHVWKHWRNRTLMEVLGPILADSHSRSEVLRCIQIGLLCVQKDAAERPTMLTVVVMLSSEHVPLQEPKELALSDQSSSNSKKVACSVDDKSITQVYPR